MKYHTYQATKNRPPLDSKFEVQNCLNENDEFFTMDKGIDYYFDSYSHFSIHEDMLKDKVFL